MADAPTPPWSIEPVLDGEEPIHVGYEAATPWLQAHCRPTNDPGEFVVPAKLLRTELLA